ncbi:hypothetical protein D3C85_425470 [compost metagenome]
MPAFWLLGNAARLPVNASRWWGLAWLGMVASGFGLYWWNKGASLADADLWRLGLGGAVIAGCLPLTRVGSRQLYVAKEMR